MRHETISGTSIVAQRLANAETHLFALISEMTGEADRERINRAIATLKRCKAVKLNVAQGRYDFTHGAYVDAAVFTRAMEG